MTLFNPTVAHCHSAVCKLQEKSLCTGGTCRLCTLNYKATSTRDDRSDVTGSEGDLTHCLSVDSLQLPGARNRAFRKGAGSKRACGAPEESRRKIIYYSYSFRWRGSWEEKPPGQGAPKAGARALQQIMQKMDNRDASTTLVQASWWFLCAAHSAETCSNIVWTAKSWMCTLKWN